MDVTCPLCSARHTLDVDTLRARPRKSVRFRCSTCGHTFNIDVTQPGEPPPDRATKVGAVTALRPVAYVRVEAENFAVPDLATLQRWVLEKRVLREDQCSGDGVSWAPLGNRPELQLFFAAADRLDRTSASAQHALLTMAHAATDDVFADAPLPGGEEEAGWLTDARTEFNPPPEAPPPAHIDLGESAEPLEAGEAGEDPDEEDGTESRHLTFWGEDEGVATAETEAASPHGTAAVRVGPPAMLDEAAASTDREWLESDEVPLPAPPAVPVTITRPRPAPINIVEAAAAAAAARHGGEPTTGPSVPRAPDGASPPRLNPTAPPIEDDEGPSVTLWVGVGICAVISVLLLLWAQGFLGPRMTSPSGEATTWSQPLPAGPTVERAGDREGPVHADEAGPLPATTPVPGSDVPTEPTPTRELTPATPPATAGTPLGPEPAPKEKAAATPPKATAKAAATDKPAQKPAEQPAEKASAEPTVAPPTEVVSGASATKVVPTKPATARVTGRAAAQPGWEAVDKEDWSTALSRFQGVLADESGNLWALYGRAYVYEHTGKTDEATRDYCNAMKRTKSADLTREFEAGLRRLGQACPE